LILLDIYSKNIEVSKFIVVRPVGSELFHANGRTDRQTDIMKLVVAFRNFANAPKYDFQIRILFVLKLVIFNNTFFSYVRVYIV